VKQIHGRRGRVWLREHGWLLAATFSFALAVPLHAQTESPSEEPTHDISMVDPAPLNGTLAIPIPEEEDSKHYEIPELAGCLPALGTQLVNGQLPHPLMDYFVRTPAVRQRITIFESGLVSIHLSGAGGVIRKKVILPPDALDNIRKRFSAAGLASVQYDLEKETSNVAVLRIYAQDGSPVERRFDPSFTLPMEMEEARRVMEDLISAMAEDRQVTSSLSNYAPHVGDRLVGEDHKAYRVSAVLREGAMVELTSLSEPVKKYYQTRDIHKFFVGTTRGETH
jgi:hypothetical protein